MGFLNLRITGARLAHRPPVEALQRPVVQTYRRTDGYSRARIDYIRPGVGGVNRARYISSDRVAGIQHAEIGILFRRHLSTNGIFKSCLFKSGLPLIDSFNKIGPPLL